MDAAIAGARRAPVHRIVTAKAAEQCRVARGIVASDGGYRIAVAGQHRCDVCIGAAVGYEKNITAAAAADIADSAIIVGHRAGHLVNVGRRARGIIIEILMINRIAAGARIPGHQIGAETGAAQRRVAQRNAVCSAVAPVQIKGKAVQRTWVNDGAGQGGVIILVDRGCQRPAHDFRRYVVYLHALAVAAHAAVVVGHRGIDRVTIRRCARRVVVQILVRQGKDLAARAAGAEVVAFDVARRQCVAPVDIQGERVQRARIRDGSGQRRHTVLVDGGDAVQNHGRRHVGDGRGQRIGVAAAVAVIHGHRDGVGAVVFIDMAAVDRAGAARGARYRARRDRAVAPVDRRRVAIQHADVGEVLRHRYRRALDAGYRVVAEGVVGDVALGEVVKAQTALGQGTAKISGVEIELESPVDENAQIAGVIVEGEFVGRVIRPAG